MNWIQALKVGDLVVLETRRYSTSTLRIAKVDRITPTGRVVAGGLTFLPTGQEHGGERYVYNQLLEPTPSKLIEARDQCDTRRLTEQFKRTQSKLVKDGWIEAVRPAPELAQYQLAPRPEGREG